MNDQNKQSENNNVTDQGTYFMNWKDLFIFNPDTIPQYLNRTRIPDCTTIAVAGRAGQLEFLKWCYSHGYQSEFDTTAFCYATTGRQKHVIEWMLIENIIQWNDPIYDLEKIAKLLAELEIDPKLIEKNAVLIRNR
jgi:hypothetical protein